MRHDLELFYNRYKEGFLFVFDMSDQCGDFEYVNSFRAVFNELSVSPDGECAQFSGDNGLRFGIDCVRAVIEEDGGMYTFVCKIGDCDERLWNVRVISV